jgi:RNA polymerase sigma-70 factor, ECF subfamily
MGESRPLLRCGGQSHASFSSGLCAGWRGYQRGGDAKPLALDEVFQIAEDQMPEVVSLDDALTALANHHPRQSQVVELRFFGGLSVEQTAETLKVSPESVARDWRAAKAWLYCELSGRGTGEDRDDA